MKHRNLQIRIIKAALRVEAETGCQIFIDRSPHVDWIRFRVYSHGWEEYAEECFTLTCNFKYGRESILEKIAEVEAWSSTIRYRQSLRESDDWKSAEITNLEKRIQNLKSATV